MYKQILIHVLGLIMACNIGNIALADTTSHSANKKKFFQKVPDISTNLQTEKDGKVLPIIELRITLMTHSKRDKELLKLHAPLYRDKIILTLNKTPSAQLVEIAQKKKLMEKVKNIINDIIMKETKSPNVVSKIYITKLLIQ